MSCIKRLVEDDLDFYPIVGRLALDREVVSGVLAPIFNEPGKVWWVALEGDAVLGLVASVPSKTGVDIKSLFVRNGCRGRGVGRRLFDACMKWCEKHYTGSITSVVSPAGCGST